MDRPDCVPAVSSTPMTGMGHLILKSAMRRRASCQVWRCDQGRGGNQDTLRLGYEDCDVTRRQYLLPSGFR